MGLRVHFDESFSFSYGLIPQKTYSKWAHKAQLKTHKKKMLQLGLEELTISIEYRMEYPSNLRK